MAIASHHPFPTAHHPAQPCARSPLGSSGHLPLSKWGTRHWLPGAQAQGADSPKNSGAGMPHRSLWQAMCSTPLPPPSAVSYSRNCPSPPRAQGASVMSWEVATGLPPTRPLPTCLDAVRFAPPEEGSEGALSHRPSQVALCLSFRSIPGVLVIPGPQGGLEPGSHFHEVQVFHFSL